MLSMLRPVAGRSCIIVRRSACRALATQATGSRGQQQHQSHGSLFAGAALLGALSGATVTLLDASPPPKERKVTASGKEANVKQPAHSKPTASVKHLDNRPPPRPDLPIYTREQVAEHCDEESMWFTYRGAVYDLTFFLHGHPGGTPRLLMAARQGTSVCWIRTVTRGLHQTYPLGLHTFSQISSHTGRSTASTFAVTLLIGWKNTTSETCHQKKLQKPARAWSLETCLRQTPFATQICFTAPKNRSTGNPALNC